MILFHLPQKPAGSLYLGLSWELKFSFSRSYCFFGVERTLLTLLWGKQSWKGCLMVLHQISEKIILNLRGDTNPYSCKPFSLFNFTKMFIWVCNNEMFSPSQSLLVPKFSNVLPHSLLLQAKVGQILTPTQIYWTL